MFIPILGVFTGALWLGEVLHWQDWAAVALMVVAIASVLWPARIMAVIPTKAGIQTPEGSPGSPPPRG
jgi:threonine/homoserine efflux transporter RhtA